ncbi:MAG: helix-turn-helix transcriptional regulator [Colwellia sp.]|nr:helix-turn-helix transcriptional regulator [Colwellia sp.]
MNRIGEVLKKQGRTQVWLSNQLGKSYNMVNSYVKNRRQPSLETLFEIANILSVRPHQLIKGYEEMLIDFMTFAIDAENIPEHSTKELIVNEYLKNN